MERLDSTPERFEILSVTLEKKRPPLLLLCLSNVYHKTGNLFFSWQFSKSNESQVTLMNLDFDATGGYYCEVSIDNPIFTKASNEEHLHVISEWRKLMKMKKK